MESIKKEISEVKNMITNFKDAICNPKVSDEELKEEIKNTNENTSSGNNLLQLGGSRSHKNKKEE